LVIITGVPVLPLDGPQLRARHFALFANGHRLEADPICTTDLYVVPTLRVARRSGQAG
jgi:hypothetical protein